MQPFYEKESNISLKEVQLPIKTKELTKLQKLTVQDNGEILNVIRGRIESGENI